MAVYASESSRRIQLLPRLHFRNAICNVCLFVDYWSVLQYVTFAHNSPIDWNLRASFDDGRDKKKWKRNKNEIIGIFQVEHDMKTIENIENVFGRPQMQFACAVPNMLPGSEGHGDSASVGTSTSFTIGRRSTSFLDRSSVRLQAIESAACYRLASARCHLWPHSVDRPSICSVQSFGRGIRAANDPKCLFPAIMRHSKFSQYLSSHVLHTGLFCLWLGW